MSLKKGEEEAAMKREAAEILRDALELPPGARAALASSLIESLDDQVDDDAEEAWAEEIARRLQEIDSSKVGLIPWTDVRSRLHGR